MNTVQIKNRSNNICVLEVPDMNLSRTFQPRGVQDIDLKDLEQFMRYEPSLKIILNYFIILNKEFAQNLLPTIATEPEYWMEDEDIIKLLKEGSTEELLDFFDFAPLGAIDILKTYSVALPVTDLSKIEIIKEKTGLNILRAIELEKELIEEENVEDSISQGRKRRVQK